MVHYIAIEFINDEINDDNDSNNESNIVFLDSCIKIICVVCNHDNDDNNNTLR